MRPSREITEKVLVTVILIACWLLLPVTGYRQEDTDPWHHLIYIWCHANVWHLFGNLFVLWIIRGRLYLWPAILAAFIVSFIPAFSIYGDMGMTVGFSGVLFAVGGIKWGVYCSRRYGRYFSACALDDFVRKALPFALVGILVPHLNWCLHLHALIFGYIYGRYKG